MSHHVYILVLLKIYFAMLSWFSALRASLAYRAGRDRNSLCATHSDVHNLSSILHTYKFMQSILYFYAFEYATDWLHQKMTLWKVTDTTSIGRVKT